MSAPASNSAADVAAASAGSSKSSKSAKTAKAALSKRLRELRAGRAPRAAAAPGEPAPPGKKEAARKAREAAKMMAAMDPAARQGAMQAAMRARGGSGRDASAIMASLRASGVGREPRSSGAGAGPEGASAAPGAAAAALSAPVRPLFGVAPAVEAAPQGASPADPAPSRPQLILLGRRGSAGSVGGSAPLFAAAAAKTSAPTPAGAHEQLDPATAAPVAPPTALSVTGSGQPARTRPAVDWTSPDSVAAAGMACLLERACPEGMPAILHVLALDEEPVCKSESDPSSGVTVGPLSPAHMRRAAANVAPGEARLVGSWVYRRPLDPAARVVAERAVFQRKLAALLAVRPFISWFRAAAAAGRPARAAAAIVIDLVEAAGCTVAGAAPCADEGRATYDVFLAETAAWQTPVRVFRLTVAQQTQQNV